MRVMMTGGSEFKSHNKKQESVFSTAATMRVLNILRHWVSKHAQVEYTVSQKKGAFLFLSERCQISTNFNKFW